MRPIAISPCSGCGSTLEHDQDPRTVLCGGCEADARAAARKNAPPPPPTTEQRRYVAPTPLEPGYRVLTLAAMVALGFLLGWIARGGV